MSESFCLRKQSFIVLYLHGQHSTEWFGTGLVPLLIETFNNDTIRYEEAGITVTLDCFALN